MEDKLPGPAKGYQKQPKKEGTNAQPPSKPKKNINTDYSSPTAKKWPLLLEALEAGDVSALKRLIEEGINVNVIRNGVTPLMLAASKGHTEIAEVLLQAGVNINEKSDDGWTALHKAAFDQAETGIVDLLMQSGIDVEAKNKSDKTSLQLAEEKKHRDIIRAIRAHQEQLRADAQEWEDFLSTPEGKPYKESKRYDSLALAFRLWWLPALVLGGVGLLLGFIFGVVKISGIFGAISGLLIGAFILIWERKLRIYLDDIGPLPYLDIHTLREKKKTGEPLSIENSSEIISAEETTDDQTIDSASYEQAADSAPVKGRSYLEAPELKKKSLKIVYLAICAFVMILLIGAIIMNRGSLAKWYFAKKLENKGIQFSEQAFLAEVAKNNEEAVDLFIKAGINSEAKDEKGQTALMITSDNGYVNILTKLVTLNAAVLNHVDESGSTALMIASSQGRENIVNVLVENGADVNYTVPSHEGAASALQAALDASDFKEEHMSVIQYLLQHGADVKGRNAAGRFPLLFAADHGRTEAAKLLIEQGADVNDADLKGNFPLLSAACKGYPWFVTLLAEKGANMKMASPDGRTPLMCAAQEGHLDTVKALLEKGAPVNAKTASGATALADAARRGNVDVVKLLLKQGADPGHGYIPDAFVTLKGRVIAIKAKKNKLNDVLSRIAKTASQDGYAVSSDANMTQKITFMAKASWNQVLNELATKNHLLLVVKDKEVFVLPYDEAGIKHEAI